MEQPCSSASILVVDNDRCSSQRMSSILREAGYTAVTSALSARRALERCSRHAPELVIIDPWVEGGSGLEVVESLTYTGDGSPVPRFLFVTADASEGPRIQAELFGAAGVVEKPCGEAEFLKSVRSALVS